MKQIILAGACFLCGCAALSSLQSGGKSRVHTQRQTPYYLSTAPEKVEDTCPGHDILKQYNCSVQDGGLNCFDVYMVQGRPVNEESYTLIQQQITPQNTQSQPLCPADVTDCASFLNALNYNLEFSWYLVNFPSSSFEQCRETYDCKRIDCSRSPVQTDAGAVVSDLISCVYKKNQLFFVGSDISCQK